MKRFNNTELLLLIAFSYCLIQGSFYPIWVLLFSLLHECGHLLALRKIGAKASHLIGGGQGFGIPIQNLGYRQEFIVALAGPAVNLLLAGIFSIISVFLNEIIISYCIYANLLLAAVNLLPIFPLDGGRMLSAALAYKLAPNKKARIMQLLGMILLLPLLAVAFWQFLTSGYNISLLLICFYLTAMIAFQTKGDFSI